MSPSTPRVFFALIACCSLAGCTGEVNTPKMPDVPPPKIEVDTSAPKARGGDAPYGANKKYQDMMNK